MKILVFIPMYNCEKQIPRVISQFDEETQKLFAEILIVDNISKDSSLLAAEEALKKLSNIKTTLIQNEENVSLGGSHKVAFNYAIDNGYKYYNLYEIGNIRNNELHYGMAIFVY